MKNIIHSLSKRNRIYGPAKRQRNGGNKQRCCSTHRTQRERAGGGTNRKVETFFWRNPCRDSISPRPDSLVRLKHLVLSRLALYRSLCARVPISSYLFIHLFEFIYFCALQQQQIRKLRPFILYTFRCFRSFASMR